MSPSLLPFFSAALWLSFLPVIQAVCHSCFGQDPSCPDSTFDACPWQTAIIANAAALVSTTISAVSVALLLPPRLLRIFSTASLSALVSLCRRPKNGAPFDLSAATPSAMLQGVANKSCTKTECVMELGTRLLAVDPTAANRDDQRSVLKSTMEIVKNLEGTTGLSECGGSEGALSFIMARLSMVCCKSSSQSFDLNVMDVERKEEPSSSGATSSGKYSATLFRPKTLEQVCSLLNLFQLVSCTTGVVSLMVISPFLDEVFFEPIRVGEISWPIAFEMVLAYIRLVENHPALYHLGNVLHKTGGIDSKRVAATKLAIGLYPKNVFRGPRVEPRDLSDDTATDDKEKAKAKFVGTVAGFNENSKRGCAAWNLGASHLNKYMSGNKCQFFHGCDQFVTDKGSYGQCLSKDHHRADCDYDPSKRCSKPVTN